MKNTKLILIAITFILSYSVKAQEMTVSLSESAVKWNAKKITGEHFGTVALKAGSLIVSNNAIIDGSFTIDMNSIVCSDLEDPEWNKKLVGHLKSDDFFGVEKYPVVFLKNVKSGKFKENRAKVTADLTIKGTTHPISFDVLRSGKYYTTIIKVDRTQFNVRYGSGKFFDNLGDNMIDDVFTVEVKLKMN
ncbi:MAG: YceI family protein [Bacteroidales bacterium]|nr:YceI family protein [Bacteroidales bacterium]HPD96089.1 YceI family protein [Tenuifilaceae bacterium]HRX32166.1 YceI family protein [Tenuifilaceae bacterium]